MKKGLIISLDSISRACTRGRGNDKKRHAFFRVDESSPRIPQNFYTAPCSIFAPFASILLLFFPLPGGRRIHTLPFRKNLSRGENFNKSLLLPF